MRRGVVAGNVRLVNTFSGFGGRETTCGPPDTSYSLVGKYKGAPLIRFIEPRVAMGTILLVDDNPLRAGVRQSLLEKSAPAVVRALDAAEALCMVESPEFARGLSLLVTSYLMKGISGPEFVAEFRSRLPEVPVLVLSTMLDFEKEYLGINGVYFSQTTSADELRSVVRRLVGMGQQQTA